MRRPARPLAGPAALGERAQIADQPAELEEIARVAGAQIVLRRLAPLERLDDAIDDAVIVEELDVIAVAAFQERGPFVAVAADHAVGLLARGLPIARLRAAGGSRHDRKRKKKPAEKSLHEPYLPVPGNTKRRRGGAANISCINCWKFHMRGTFLRRSYGRTRIKCISQQ